MVIELEAASATPVVMSVLFVLINVVEAVVPRGEGDDDCRVPGCELQSSQSRRRDVSTVLLVLFKLFFSVVLSRAKKNNVATKRGRGI